MQHERDHRAVGEDEIGKKQVDLLKPLYSGPEIELQAPALIPDDYIPDVQTRLVLYKRIAHAASNDTLKDIQVDMIDRFGLLPQPLKNLIAVAELKSILTPLCVQKAEIGPQGGFIDFNQDTPIEPHKIIQWIQLNARHYKLQANRLRITKPLPTFEDRLQELYRFIDFVHNGK